MKYYVEVKLIVEDDHCNSSDNKKYFIEETDLEKATEKFYEVCHTLDC